MNAQCTSFDDFYADAYSAVTRERRFTSGQKVSSLFFVDQPPGEYPDGALCEHIVQLNVGKPCKALIDAGFGKRPVPIETNQFVVGPAHTRVEYDTQTDVRLIVFGICSDLTNDVAQAHGLTNFDPGSLIEKAATDPVAALIIRELWREAGTSQVTDTVAVDTAVMALAARLLGATKAAPAGGTISPTGLSCHDMNRVDEYIEANLAEQIRVADIAEVTGLPAATFARAFKLKTGLSPYQSVLQHRIARARAMLLNGELSIAEIAYAVGFSSQAHFTTVFKAHFGLAPAQFRMAMDL